MTAITAEQLLGFIRNATTTITLPDLSGSPEWMSTGGGEYEVVDARELIRGIEELIDAQPQVVFADLVGKTYTEATAALDARAPYLKQKHPVGRIVVLANVLGRATAERTANAEGIPVKPGELLVRTEVKGSDHYITEIIKLGA